MRPVRAGEPVRFTLDSGTVVSISKIVSHKRSGDAGRHLHCERLPTSSEVLSGAIDVRQRSDGGVHQERGGARDRTLWCRWPYGCSSVATARRLRWFPSICQECTTSRRIPCPESARLWPRSGRWPWRVYDPCLPSGASYGSTCLRHSPTDDSSSSHRGIRTPGRSGQMPCPCLGTTGGTFLNAFPSFKMVPQVLQKIAQSPGVEVILIAQLQPADRIPLFVEGQDLLTQDVWTGDGVTENRHFRPSNLPCGNSLGHPESKGSFQGSCQHDVKVPSGIFTTSVWIPLVKIRGEKMARVSSQKSSFQHLHDAPLQGRTTSFDVNIISHVCGFCATSLGVRSSSRPAHQATGQGFPAGTSSATQNHA